jgi:hypothetical protein
MEEQIPELQGTLNKVSGAFSVGGFAAARASAGANAGRTDNHVQVYIGNEQLDSRMVRVANSQQNQWGSDQFRRRNGS